MRRESEHGRTAGGECSEDSFVVVPGRQIDQDQPWETGERGFDLLGGACELDPNTGEPTGLPDASDEEQITDDGEDRRLTVPGQAGISRLVHGCRASACST